MEIRIGALVVIACVVSACHSDDGTNQVTIDRLQVSVPRQWQQVPPSSKMRLAQFVIAGPAGPAELAVFHFGVGQGGDVETNVTRWLGQIELAPGSAPQRESLEHDGLRITGVDAIGTLLPGQMGMGPRSPQPSSRLFGAVVEGDGGPWFFKATGPDATLAPQRDAFFSMLKTIRLVER